MKNLNAAILALRGFSSGVLVIAILFLVSALLVISRHEPEDGGMRLWLFSPEHRAMYLPLIEQYEQDKDIHLAISLMSIPAIQSRMMSGFFSGLETADLIEVERSAIGQAFMGPTDAVGFTDLTKLLTEEGLIDKINKPSLSPWSIHGRVFGLPHDVHPVMLAYRADITEAAGIDLTQAETWDDYFQLLRPLMNDDDGDGKPDHTPLSFWYTNQDLIETLMLEGDGQLFDEQGHPTIATDRNAWLLATLVSWCVGDDPVATDINEWSAAGHQAKLDAVAIGYIAPDWMCSIWKMQVPGLSGKLKLMPLPAFEPGGRRTSVRGGTMLGIPKSTTHFDQAWDYAKLLYTSPEVARELYRRVDIISPIRSLWNDPVYDEPDPFFMNQAKGRMYIELAPQIPQRPSSPYNKQAVIDVRDAMSRLARWSGRGGKLTVDELLPEAKKLLAQVQKQTERRMARNAFAAQNLVNDNSRAISLTEKYGKDEE
ncbi:MAG: ABC transporter substrate-binding protein [Phycisphaerales bacterium]